MAIQYLDLNCKTILENWTISDAIRELISNAYDESVLSNTIDPKIFYDPSSKQISIIDYGRGINSYSFIQNENNEKKLNKKIIGKFGVGLKDAIAVLFKFNKNITIQSVCGTFSPVMKNKNNINDIQTIHIEYNDENKISHGTTIIIKDIDYRDFELARDYFISFNKNIELLGTSKKGEVYINKNNSEASIYFNGLKVSTDQDLHFSYNILEANKVFLNGLNRERKFLSRDIYRELIIGILKSVYNETKCYSIIHDIYKLSEEPNKKEWSFIDVKEFVLKNLNNNIFIATNKQLPNLSILDLSKYNCCILSEKEYKSLSNKGVLTFEQFQKEYLSNFFNKENHLNDIEESKKDNLKFVLSWIEKNLLNKWKDLKNIWDKIKINIVDLSANITSFLDHNKYEIYLSKFILDSKQLIYSNLIKQYCSLILGKNLDDEIVEYILKISAISHFNS